MEQERPITFELSTEDLQQLQAGLRAGKTRKVFMTTPGLVELRQQMLNQPKQILAGNSSDGYVRMNTTRF